MESEVITTTEKELREERGLGGYTLYLNAGYCMDSYQIRSSCKASMANDPRDCWDTKRQRRAAPNARLMKVPGKNSFYLRAVDNICINDEICYSYGNSYKFPSKQAPPIVNQDKV
jgi:hypothetical protein